MDKKLLVDLSKIIRDIESKNLFKEADALSNCLVKLAQMTEGVNTPESSAPLSEVPEVTMPETSDNKNLSNEFITESNDFSNKINDFSRKAADIASTGRQIDSMELDQLNKIIEQGNKLISMNEAKGSELEILRNALDQFVAFKNKLSISK